jgi:hypothetical protein
MKSSGEVERIVSKTAGVTSWFVPGTFTSPVWAPSCTLVIEGAVLAPLCC